MNPVDMVDAGKNRASEELKKSRIAILQSMILSQRKIQSVQQQYTEKLQSDIKKTDQNIELAKITKNSYECRISIHQRSSNDLPQAHAIRKASIAKSSEYFTEYAQGRQKVLDICTTKPKDIEELNLKIEAARAKGTALRNALALAKEDTTRIELQNKAIQVSAEERFRSAKEEAHSVAISMEVATKKNDNLKQTILQIDTDSVLRDNAYLTETVQKFKADAVQDRENYKANIAQMNEEFKEAENMLNIVTMELAAQECTKNEVKAQIETLNEELAGAQLELKMTAAEICDKYELAEELNKFTGLENINETCDELRQAVLKQNTLHSEKQQLLSAEEVKLDEEINEEQTAIKEITVNINERDNELKQFEEELIVKNKSSADCLQKAKDELEEVQNQLVILKNELKSRTEEIDVNDTGLYVENTPDQLQELIVKDKTLFDQIKTQVEEDILKLKTKEARIRLHLKAGKKAKEALLKRYETLQSPSKSCLKSPKRSIVPNLKVTFNEHVSEKEITPDESEECGV